MKSGVLFATLLVIFVSCASNIFAKSSCEDKTDISSQAPSPQLDIQIKNKCFMIKKLNLMLPIIQLDFVKNVHIIVLEKRGLC
uniref:Uncharacterized protein n=1 Tax=Brassica campestris TaxID=3711 RepID=A0A3P6C606_BRACM|nr:unnamed protein product [Brassica rapa]